jgi:Fe-S-cluster containining protein
MRPCSSLPTRPLTPSSPSLQARDAALLLPIDAAFARVRERHPGALPCSRGCSYCCVAFFEVTALDLWRLRNGLETLDPATRADVLERSRRVVALAREAVPGWGAPYDVRDISEAAFVRLSQALSAACPALGRQGECRIYDHRPRICRLQGLSFFDPGGGAELPDFCADAFGDEAYAAIPPQPLPLYDQWEEEAALRREVSRDLPLELGGGYRTFIAGALLALAGEVDPEVGGCAAQAPAGVDPEATWEV